MKEDPHKEIKKSLSLLENMIKENVDSDKIFLVKAGVEREILYASEKGYLKWYEVRDYFNKIYFMKENQNEKKI